MRASPAGERFSRRDPEARWVLEAETNAFIHQRGMLSRYRSERPRFRSGYGALDLVSFSMARPFNHCPDFWAWILDIRTDGY
jgi:hypothetical protein